LSRTLSPAGRPPPAYCRSRGGPLPSLVIDGALSTEISENSDEIVVHVRGDVAYSTCRLLQDAVAPLVAPGRKVVLEFSDVTLLDSSGIGVMLRALRALEEVKGTLVVRNPTPASLQVLEITGLHDRLVENPQDGAHSS
jgi:anti-sigma B factor antagonist